MTFCRVRLSLLTIWNIFLVLPIVSSDHDYMPGYHRRLHPASYTNKDVQEISDGVVKTINILIEEQARRRFLEHLQQLRASGSNSLPAPSHRVQDDLSEQHRPTYSYQLPLSNQINPNEPIHFAVGPNDPRYYDKTDEMLSGESLESVGIYPQEDQKGPSVNEGGNARLSAPLLPIQPKIGKGGHGRNRSNAAVGAGIESSFTDRTNSNTVVQQPIELGNRFGMYLIAMIAGVSAAVTVALISVAFGWYTLHKRNKAAADVEYPAYGVTGPNRDTSAATAAAAGDRKLAQNAQMYHYQHQKQQIIAMENTTRSSIHSEQPSEDENEEGDYTVYECPGLAPTGEMEVKNPLFLEDAPGGGMSLQASLSGDGPAVGAQYVEKAVQPQTRTNNK